MKNIDKVKSVVQTIFDNNEVELRFEITKDTKLREDLQMDSLMLAELSVRIEDEFGVDVFETKMVYTIEEILFIINLST
jgi:acyl carrier protein